MAKKKTKKKKEPKIQWALRYDLKRDSQNKLYFYDNKKKKRLTKAEEQKIYDKVGTKIFIADYKYRKKKQ